MKRLRVGLVGRLLVLRIFGGRRIRRGVPRRVRIRLLRLLWLLRLLPGYSHLSFVRGPIVRLTGRLPEVARVRSLRSAHRLSSVPLCLTRTRRAPIRV